MGRLTTIVVEWCLHHVGRASVEKEVEASKRLWSCTKERDDERGDDGRGKKREETTKRSTNRRGKHPGTFRMTLRAPQHLQNRLRFHNEMLRHMSQAIVRQRSRRRSPPRPSIAKDRGDRWCSCVRGSQQLDNDVGVQRETFAVARQLSRSAKALLQAGTRTFLLFRRRSQNSFEGQTSARCAYRYMHMSHTSIAQLGNPGDFSENSLALKRTASNISEPSRCKARSTNVARHLYVVYTGRQRMLQW